jgi:hypothetical protein
LLECLESLNHQEKLDEVGRPGRRDKLDGGEESTEDRERECV